MLAGWQERFIYLPDGQDFWDCAGAARASLAPREYGDTRMYVSEHLAPNTPVVVVYHGNAGSACDRIYYVPLLEAAGYATVLVEYAGYSDDPVPPGHARIKQDVLNVIAFLNQEAITSVTVLGESIGSGPASYHAAEASPAQLILITPFTSLRELARYHYWFYPTNWLVNNAFDNQELLTDYTGAILLIHGDRDQTVPAEMSEILAAERPESTTLRILPGVGHNDLFLHPEFSTVFVDWLRR